MNIHEFEPIMHGASICRVCLKPAMHVNHPRVLTVLSSKDANEPAHIVPPEQHKFISPTVNGKFVLGGCFQCGKLCHDPIHIQEEHELVTVASDPLPCNGHTCPSCGCKWTHDYACGGLKTNGLCNSCAQESAAKINRPEHIEEVANTRQLTGAEASELRLHWHEFTVMTLIHDPDGGVRPDWNQRVSDFIQAKEKIIEELRIQISTAKVARVDQETEDITKLTPEERAQYERDAAKLKVKRERKQAPKAVDTKKAYNDLLSQLCKSIRVKNPKMSQAEIEQVATKRADALLGDD